MDEPPVAKLAPRLKFVPIESRYALRYGNFRFSAAQKNGEIKIMYVCTYVN